MKLLPTLVSVAVVLFPTSRGMAIALYPNSTGQVVFSELMIDAASTASTEKHEFVELKSVSSDELRLDGCVLIEAGTTECVLLPGQVGNCDLIPTTSYIGLMPGGYAYFARSAEFGSDCGLTPTAIYSKLSLNNGTAETLRLFCPDNTLKNEFVEVASFRYDWAKLTDKFAGHTYALHQDAVSGYELASNWCVTPDVEGAQFCSQPDGPEYGSPGATNLCPEMTPTPPPTQPPTPTATLPPATPTATPTQPPTPPLLTRVYPPAGGVVISEIMVDPPTNVKEWFEITATAYTDQVMWDLKGCKFMEGPCASPDDVACAPGCTTTSCAFNETVLGSSLLLPPGERRLLQQSGECTAYDGQPAEGAACVEAPDATYTRMTFNSDRAESLFLMCPGEGGAFYVVDSIRYDWRINKADCDLTGGRGCSLTLDPAQLDATANDAPANFCVAGSDTSFFSTTGAISYGTPGAINSCPLPPEYPGVGDLVFTEIMVAPTSGGHEYLELKALTAGTRGPWDLDGCTLREGPCTDLNDVRCDPGCEEGVENDCLTSWHDYTLGDVQVEAGSRAIFQYGSGCTAYDQDPDLGGVCQVNPQVTYSTLGFNNTGTESVFLFCPDGGGGNVVIDQITYNWGELKVDCALEGGSGCSVQARVEEAAANDLPESWCVAGDGSPFYTQESNLSYGSPGADTLCQPPPPPVVSPAVGAVVFSEVMVAPGEGGLEWIELYTRDEVADQNLQGCVLREGPCAPGEEDLCAPECEGEDCKTHWNEYELDVYLPTRVGEPILLQKGEGCTAYGMSTEEGALCLAQPVATYGTLGLNNTDVEYLYLLCPGEVDGSLYQVDGTQYNWASVQEECTTPSHIGCSLQRRDEMGALPSEDGVEVVNWCVSGELTPFYTEAAALSYGTPGELNLCPPEPPPPHYPAAGDVMFTELMPAPASGGVEWLELTVVGDPGEVGTFDLAGCILREGACADVADPLCADTCEGDGCQTAWHDSIVGDLSLPAGGITALSEGADCISYPAEGETDQTCLVSGSPGYSNLSFNDTSQEWIYLLCPGEDGVSTVVVDSATYNWAEQKSECTSGNGCSLATAAGVTDPAANNDLTGFCISGEDTPFLTAAGQPSYGTPGAANVCAAPPGPVVNPPADSLLITELMVAPGEGIPEWFEMIPLSEPDGDAWDLKGCKLVQGPCDDPINPDSLCAPTCEGDGCLSDWNTATFTTRIPLVGQAFVFQKVSSDGSTCVAWDGTRAESGTCISYQTASYSSVTFANTVASNLFLICQNELEEQYIVDQASYDPAVLEAGCGVGATACTLELPADRLQPSANNTAAGWCVAPEGGGEYYDASDKLNYGTPGRTNNCGAPPMDPADIQLVFTEIMVAPDSYVDDLDPDSNVDAHEWFEWVNLGGEANLSGCWLELEKVGSDGVDVYPFAQLGLGATVPQGARQVWAEGGCLFSGAAPFTGEDGDGAVDTSGEEVCLTADLVEPVEVLPYSGLTFSNSGIQFLSLKCAGEDQVVTEIDVISFDLEAYDLEAGRSWQVEPEFESSEGNDQSENWCNGSYEKPYYNGPGKPNYGTPGSVNVCSTVTVDDVHRCTCTAGDSSPAGRLGLLVLCGLTLHLRRRISKV